MGTYATYTCSKCQVSKPFGDFRMGGRITGASSEWVCWKCNACPHCCSSSGDGDRHVHRCHVPLLTQALGVELDPNERQLIKWICVTINGKDAETLAGLFVRSRQQGLGGQGHGGEGHGGRMPPLRVPDVLQCVD